MQTNRAEILGKTHGGLHIYSHILQQFYPDEVVLHLSGNQCKPVRNPFSGGYPTLNIFNQNGIFRFTDTNDQAFRGDPFDFASLYYNLQGEALLQRIAEELHLNNGFQYGRLTGNKVINQPITATSDQPISIPEFSFFNRPVTNTIPARTISLAELYKLIKSNLFEANTCRLREIRDKTAARKFKASGFDYVTFAGIFSRRTDKELIRHSGLITIDFDHLTNIDGLKQSLLADKFFETEMLFTSPSGDGLKWIIPVDLLQGSHYDNFRAMANYVSKVYYCEADSSGKDISRACFLPCDPNIYINPKYIR